MRRRLMVLAAAGLATLAGLAVLLVPGPALAGEGRIVGVDAERGELRVVFEGRDFAANESIDPESVQVRLAGTVLDATAEPIGDSAQVDRSVLLVLDISSSMQGEKIEAAKEAAGIFLSTVPADVKVGLVTFASEARVLVPPTTDREAVRQQVEQLRARGGTVLYDGIQLALRTLTGDGVRSILLLSDGVDRVSEATLPGTVEALRESGVDLNAVTLLGTDVTEVLTDLVAPSSGRLVAATDETQLRTLFEASAEAIARQVLITAPLPADIQAGEFDVTVEATAAGEPLRDEALLLLDSADLPGATARPGPVAAPASRGFVASPTALTLAAVLMFGGLAIIAGFAFSAFASSRREADVRRRLARYSLTNPMAPGARDPITVREEPGGPATILGDSNIAKSAVELAERVVASRDAEGKLAARLESAAIPFRPAEWVLLHAAVAVLPSLVLLLISGGDLALSALALLIGGAGPYIYLSIKRSSRRQKFEEQLPGTLQLLAGSLQAGYSLPQAVDTVAREAAEPVATEFGRAIMESRLAVPIEDALDHVAERTDSEDFSWVVMAVRIQHEVGGNLAELLTTIAGTLRERERLRRQVRVLSAEGRLSAYILGGLPIIFAIYLFVVRREYLMKLFSDPIGLVLVAGGVVSLLLGAIWMRKIVNVEV